MSMIRFSLWLFATLAPSTLAFAGTVYQTGFESPTYSAGPLTGQNGWAGLGTVEMTTVRSGSQALEIDSGIQGACCAEFAYNSNVSFAPAVGADILTFSDDVYIADSTSNSVWIPLELSILNGVPGPEFDVAGDTVYSNIFGGQALLSLTPNSWNNFSITVDFSTGNVLQAVNGTGIASRNFSTQGGQFVAGPSFGLIPWINPNATDTMFVDNVTVAAQASTPEPSSIMLVSFGLLICVTRVYITSQASVLSRKSLR